MASGVSPPSAPQSQSGRVLTCDQYIETQLRKTSSGVKAVDLAFSLLLLVVATLAYFVLMAVVDHWIVPGGLGSFGRAVFFVILLAGVAAYVVLRVVPILMGRINPIYAAYTIEHSAPGLKNSLLNFMLFRGRQRGEVPEPIYQAMEQQAAARLSTVPVELAVDRSHILRVGYVLMALAVVCALYKVLSPKDPLVTVQRILLPWADILPPSRVKIEEVKPGTTAAVRGEQVTVSARIRGIGPQEEIKLIYTTDDGQAVDRVLPMHAPEGGDKFIAELPESEAGMQEGLVYRIEAGDAVSRHYRLEVITAPTIALKTVFLDYPEYTKLVDRRYVRDGNLRGIEGTQVTLRAETNAEIKSAWVDFGNDRIRDLQMQAKGTEAWVTFPLELDAQRRGPKYASYSLRYTSVEDRSNYDPVQYQIDVIADIAPEIVFLQPEPSERETKVALDGILLIETRAIDPDFALAKVELRGKVGEREVLLRPLLDKEQQGQFVGKYELVPSKENLKPGDVVEYWAIAADNKRPQPNQTETEHYRFTVTAPEDPNQDQLAQNNPNENPNPDQEKNPDQQDKQKEQPMAGEGQAEQQDPAKNQPNQNDPDQQNPQQQDPNGGDPNQEQDPGEKNRQDQKQPEGEEQNSQGDSQDGGEPQAGEGTGDSQTGGEGSKDKSKSGEKGERGGEGQAGSPEEGEESEDSESPNASGGQPGKSGKPGKSNSKTGEDSGDANSERETSPEGGEPGTGSKSQGSKSQDSKSQGKSSADPREGAADGQPSEVSKDDEGTVFDRLSKALKEKQQERQQQENSERQAGEPMGNADPRQADGQKPRDDQLAKNNPKQESSPKNQPDQGQGAQKQPGQEDSPPGQDSRKQQGDKQDPMPGQSGQGGEENSAEKAGTEKAGEEQEGSEKAGDPKAGTEKNQTPGAEEGTGKEPMTGNQPGGQPDKKEQPGGEPMPGEGQAKKKEPAAGEDNGQGDKPMTGEQPGDGAQAKPGHKKEKPEQKTPGDSKTGEEAPQGGEGERHHGSGGAGKKMGDDPAGTPDAQNQAKPKDKADQPGGEKKSDEKEKSPGHGTSENDSQGEQGGDKAGGGEEGGGQRAPRRGTGSDGQNTPADQGGGTSHEAGDNGQTSDQGGSQTKGPQPAQSEGDKQAGKGREKQPGDKTPGKEEQGAAESVKDALDNARSKPKSDANGQQSSNQGGSGDTSEPQGGDGSRSSNSSSSPDSGEAPPAADPNLEYTRKATDLVLEYLEDQLRQDELSREVQEQLPGWTKEDIQNLVDRTRTRQEAAKGNDANSARAQKELNDWLRSLGLKKNEGRGVTQQAGDTQDAIGGLRQSRGSRPPAEYADQVEAYKKGLSKRKP